MFKAVGIVTSFEDVTVVGDSVEQCRGHLGIAKDADPFAKAEVGGDKERGLLIQLADQVEQQGSTRCRKR